MNRIKELRQNQKLSQKELSHFLQIAQNTLSYWEQGKYEPDNTSLIKLSDFFNVSIDYLLGRTDNKKAPSQLSEGANNISQIENAETNQIMDLVHRLDENQLKTAKEYLDFLLMKQEQKENQ